MSSTRRLTDAEAFVVWVHPDGTPEWDHRNDDAPLTPEQADTKQMLRNGYKSAQKVNRWNQEDKAAALARCKNNPLAARSNAHWERCAEETERLLKESEPRLRAAGE